MTYAHRAMCLHAQRAISINGKIRLLEIQLPFLDPQRLDA